MRVRFEICILKYVNKNCTSELTQYMYFLFQNFCGDSTFDWLYKMGEQRKLLSFSIFY
jgi:hypothetical protein